MNTETKRPRRSTVQDEHDALVQALRDSGALRSPSELVETVSLPTDLAAALATSRPELLALVQPRAMDEEEVGRLYRLIGVLIRTNAALAEHARQASAMAASIEQQLKGTIASARRLGQFAAFAVFGDGEEG